jgi:hypothetical protein
MQIPEQAYTVGVLIFKEEFFKFQYWKVYVVSPTPPVGMGLLMVCGKISDFSS